MWRKGGVIPWIVYVVCIIIVVIVVANRDALRNHCRRDDETHQPSLGYSINHGQMRRSRVNTLPVHFWYANTLSPPQGLVSDATGWQKAKLERLA
jgi:hypothetical protein